MNIDLTPAAAEQIRLVRREYDPDAPDICLRVGIKELGPRPRYTLTIDGPDAEHKVVTEVRGIGINCREEDRAHLDGITIDYHAGAKGFVLTPPGGAGAGRSGGDSGAGGAEEVRVREALCEVIDPEVGINIVDLGLVYGVSVNGDGVQVRMTMTTPACPLGEQIRSDVRDRVLQRCPGIDRVDVDIVWDPPWGPEKISDRARELLGWSR
jgi:metal-sulfur cluster biosynthetic enzyme/Fe-S cluster assembly iron-binding protein IscA